MSLSDSEIYSFDDGISIKSGSTAAARTSSGAPCQHISVTNTTVVSLESAICIGAEIAGSVFNVSFSGIRISLEDESSLPLPTTGPPRPLPWPASVGGIVIKAQAGRLAGVVDRITFDNVQIGWVVYGILINLCDPTYRVLQENLKCVASTAMASTILGPPPHELLPPTVKRVTYRNVRIRHANTSILFFGSSLATTTPTPMGPLELCNVSVTESVGFCSHGSQKSGPSFSVFRTRITTCLP